MKNTYHFLEEKYGPLMTIKAVAQILDRSPQGLRVSLHSSSELSDALNACRKRIGRRVYFNTEAVAQMLDDTKWNIL